MTHYRAISLKPNDGGRADAGFKGETGDCVTRAIAIAFNKPYKEVYDLVNQFAQDERLTKRRKTKSSARTGVRKSTTKKIIESLGGVWKPIMTIGSGCKVHLKHDELPTQGTYILRVSGHICTYIDGVLHDTYDCSRNGTRCVYGWWEVKKD